LHLQLPEGFFSSARHRQEDFDNILSGGKFPYIRIFDKALKLEYFQRGHPAIRYDFDSV